MGPRLDKLLRPVHPPILLSGRRAWLHLPYSGSPPGAAKQVEATLSSDRRLRSNHELRGPLEVGLRRKVHCRCPIQ
jgi:hypothetical protein